MLSITKIFSHVRCNEFDLAFPKSVKCITCHHDMIVNDIGEVVDQVLAPHNVYLRFSLFCLLSSKFIRGVVVCLFFPFGSNLYFIPLFTFLVDWC